MLKNTRKFALLLISFIIILSITSCNDKKLADDIIVEGFVKNLPDGKVYLTDAYNWRVIFDSTKATNGHFKFHLKSDTSFVPFLASIRYPDSTRKEYYQIRMLIYLNSYESRGKIKSGTSSFFLGPEGAVIKGRVDLNSATAIKVYAGNDNELYQRLSGKGFGYISSVDSVKRLNRMRYFKNLVSENPDSYFLFRAILNDKEHYTEKELKEITLLFRNDVQESRLGKELRIYLANRTDPGVPYTNLVLLDSRNEKNRIINPKAKLNMLIFWASWCGPCRQEIPALKKMHQAFHNKGLRMVGISIDEDQSNWHKALMQENMSWQQFIVQKDQLLKVKQQFNINAIPVIVLTDSLGKEITKTVGYSDSDMTIINGIAAKHL